MAVSRHALAGGAGVQECYVERAGGTISHIQPLWPIRPLLAIDVKSWVMRWMGSSRPPGLIRHTVTLGKESGCNQKCIVTM
jgi:hypothetical protein